MHGIGVATLGKVHKINFGLIPDAPTGVTATASGNTAADVTWTDATTGVYYLVYQNTVNVFASASIAGQALQGVQTLHITGLTPGQQYWFWVRTVNVTGNLSVLPGGPATVTMGNLATVVIDTAEHVLNDDNVEETRVFNIDEGNYE